MASALTSAFAVARETFAEASEVLHYDLAELCDRGPETELARTVRSQPALLATSVAAYRVVRSELGLKPDWGAGHSLGEVSALTCAGVLRFRDAIRLVETRGQLMQAAAPPGEGLMAAIFGVLPEKAASICSATAQEGLGYVTVANINADDQVVLSGEVAAVRHACARLHTEGGVVHELAISIPAHSTLMQPAADGFARALEAIPLSLPAFPILSNVDAEPCPDPEAWRSRLVTQLTSPVQWRAISNRLIAEPVDVVVELGAGTVLRDLFKVASPATRSFSTGNADGVDAIRRFLQPAEDEPAGADRVHSSGHSKPREDIPREAFLKKCLTVAVATRNRGAEAAKYNVGIVEPYRKLEALRHRQFDEGQEPDDGEIRYAAELLRRILRTKRVPASERSARFSSLFRETSTARLFPDFDP